MDLPNYSQPTLFDEVVQQYQQELKNRLPWLNYSYGIAVTITTTGANSEEYKIPAVYDRGKEYKNICPSDIDGNYCFFYVDDPQRIDELSPYDAGKVTSDISIVFWYDTRTIGMADERNRNYVKAEILKALKQIKPKRGSITFNTMYDEPSNVFERYDLSETDNQYLIQPFAGVRIVGEITAYEPCYNS